MAVYPDTPEFSALNTPLGKEHSLQGLVIEGTLPPEIEGDFFRAVPDPAFPPMFADDTALSGDGMIGRIRFRNGQVDFDLKYVATARHQAELAANRTLFGKYRNPFTDDPSVAGVDRTVANTTPVWHAGRLLMTKEDGLPYRIDPETLATLGSYNFDGALKSETMTAHVRIDPESGELFFFGYEAGGLATTDIAYCIVDAAGNLVREQWFKAPYCAMAHDFVITEHYAIFPLFPTTADLDRLKAGGDHWVHHQDLPSWVAVMPRYGDVAEMRWFKGPDGASSYHFMNAFERDGAVHVDLHVSDTNAFPFIRRASDIDRQQWEINGGTTRWSMDLAGSGDGVVQERPLGPPGDMPRIPDAMQGRPYPYGWYLTVNPQSPPLVGGPVGTCFNMLLRIEPDTGRIDALPLPPAHAINEPVHVPSATPGHQGWLIAVIDRQTGDNDYAHEAWVIDGGNIAAGPVAKVQIPVRCRPQVHGWWVQAG